MPARQLICSRFLPRPDCVRSSGSPEQDEESAWGCWSRRRRHFFIVTSAGKPVYSRHGDEAALAGGEQLQALSGPTAG
jgi:hypothetical protein